MPKRNKNQYLADGDVTSIITKNGVAVLIDTEDAERLRDYTWCISGNGYAMSRTKGPAVIMHRMITNADADMYVDHINGNILDNRKENLRVCKKQENEFNQKIRVDNTTGYRGVCKNSRSNKFRAYIVKDGRQYWIGLFDTAEEAARAYNTKALELFGEFARLNTLPQ